MKNTFVNLVQKCICIDFLLNALMKSNSYNHFKFLPKIRSENLKNIKIICYLYENLNKDVLVLSNTKSIKIDKNHDRQINLLLKYISDVLDYLYDLRNFSFYFSYSQVISRLIDSYFGFFSSIYCLLYGHSFRTPISQQFKFHDILTKSLPEESFQPIDSTPTRYYRQVCIESIGFIFDFNLIEKIISEESYEVFFDKNPANKFYQYYFRSNDKIFKVRIYDFNAKIFNIYQYIESESLNPTPLSKEEAVDFCNSYLKSKFEHIFNFLSMDKNYLITSTYKDSTESYKFKYNFLDNFGKPSPGKSLFITINTVLSYIEELSILF